MVLGAVNLSKGLRNNSTLKQLHLSFCQLPPEAGLPIAEVTPPFVMRFPLLCFFASVWALYISLPMFLHIYSSAHNSNIDDRTLYLFWNFIYMRISRSTIQDNSKRISYCNAFVPLISLPWWTLLQVLCTVRTSLEVLGLTGNRLGGRGLSGLCKGLALNTRLKTLYLADNMIDQVTSRDKVGMYMLRSGKY